MKLVLGLMLLCLGTAWSATLPCIPKLNARGQAALKKKAVVVVDPFGFRAGELLASRISDMGFHPIIVLSRPNLPAFLVGKFDVNGPDVITGISTGMVTQQINELAARLGVEVVGILPGTESGVPLADALSIKYHLPSNKFSYGYRRDKVEMHNRLKLVGLRYSPSRHVTTVEDIAKFIDEELSEFPGRRLVVKPPQSAGTDRVFISNNQARFQEFLDAIVDKEDAFGDVYPHAVAMAELVGPEYIFDTVSTKVMRDGQTVQRHLAVGAWRYHRRPSADPDRAPIIESVEWVPYDQLPEGLTDYALKVLDALGVSYGPAHLEIVMTKEGPTLVELGARLPGGLPLLAAEATGQEFNQIDLAIACYTDPERIARLVEKYKGGFPTKQKAEIVFLSVDEEGVKKNLSALAEVNKDNFPTLNDVRVFGPDEATLKRTVDVTNPLLRAHFVGTPAQVKSDVEALRKRHREREFYTAP